MALSLWRGHSLAAEFKSTAPAGHDLINRPKVGFFSDETKNFARAIVVQSNGQGVVGGMVEDASPVFGDLARLDSNGDLHVAFGSGGTIMIGDAINALLINAN